MENVKRDRLRCLRRSDLRRNQGTLARRFRSQRYRQVSVSISKRRVLRSKFVLYWRWQVSVNFLLATEVHGLKRNYKNSTAFLIFYALLYFQTYSQCAVCIYCTLSFSRCFSFYYLLDLGQIVHVFVCLLLLNFFDRLLIRKLPYRSDLLILKSYSVLQFIF